MERQVGAHNNFISILPPIDQTKQKTVYPIKEIQQDEEENQTSRECILAPRD